MPPWPRRTILQSLAAAAVAFPARAEEQQLVIEQLAPNQLGLNGAAPGPLLQWRQGEDVVLRVTNRLNVPSSLHWHGIRTPAAMDGVPGLSFPGIMPGESFVYRFRVHQSGTYWYHSHSGLQEQIGLYGPIVVTPRNGWPDHADRDYVVLLSDHPAESPERIISKLKFQSDAYDFQRPTLLDLLRGKDNLKSQLQWSNMRMSPSDISDVTAATYQYLCNGLTATQNWTGLFTPGETVRLRVINASSMSFFDLRIPDLAMQVVASDGNAIAPVEVEECRIAPGETYDVLVRPQDRAYRIFAQSYDRSGFATGTLAPRAGMTALIPPMDPPPRRTMADMGQSMGQSMDMSSMPGMTMPMTSDRFSDPGDGLQNNHRRVLTYADLKARIPGADPRPPSREITLHLTGDMRRYMWGFDGKKYSQSEPIQLVYGERVRIILINDTMMDHPIHLHGLWSELENRDDEFRPYKHTITVKPAERLSFLVTADTPGKWAFHCHLLYHMAMGMFRVVEVA